MRISDELRYIASLMIFSLLLACRPILSIGWEEILVLMILGGLLFGPGFLRLYQFWQRMKIEAKEDHHQDKKEG